MTKKTRMSSFPMWWYVFDYLLGHDYVSFIDIVKNACVSCSGDGAIKLWDSYNYRLLDTYTSTDATIGDNDDSNYACSCISIHKYGKNIESLKQQHKNSNDSANNNNNQVLEFFSVEKML